MIAPSSLLVPALCLAAVATPAVAEPTADSLSVTGNLRFRYESIVNQARAGFNADDELVTLRTQIKVTLKHHNLTAVAEVHDSRAYGANAGTPLTTGDVNAIEPVQAYLQADLGSALGRGTTTRVQAGRFTLELGSRRLVANDDYRNATNSFTGIKADFTAPGGIKATAVYVLPAMRLPDDGPSLRRNASALDRESFAAVLWGATLARQPKGSRVLAEALFLHFGERDATGRPTRDRSLDNFGLRLIADPAPGQFDGGIEGIYQWGRTATSLTPAASRVPVSATFGRIHAGYMFTGPWKPRVLAELDRASGDGTGPTYARFDPLFGMRRGDLAPSALYSAVARSNVLSPGLRLEITPSKRLDAFIGYRALWLADSHDAFGGTGVRDATGNSGSFAGHQFDMRVRRWLIPQRVRLEVDGIYLARGRFLETAPNGRAGNVRYLSFNLSGSF